MKIWPTGLILCLSLTAVDCLLIEREIVSLRAPFGRMPMSIRHVEFVGTVDNGTLDCSVPGFTEFRWQLINKVSAGPYAESASIVLDGKIKPHQSKIKIGKGGLPMATEMLVVSCELMLNDRPRFQFIWVVTRLHSPLGYPTDPRFCFFKRDRRFPPSCGHFEWQFNTDCYHGKGQDYKGYAYVTKGNPPLRCQYWFQNSPNPRSDVYDVGFRKEHNFCRNPSEDHSPWCFTSSRERPKEFCRVQECSDCMYGLGNGTFPLYRYIVNDFERHFPVYDGRTLLTVKKGSDGKPRKCLTGKNWKWNFCRPREDKVTPHCYIAKEEKDEPHVKHIKDSRVELVECRIPQCTVRQVWFLFFSSFENPYLKESNLEAVEILLIHGFDMKLVFIPFGIHLKNGFSVSSDDSRLVKYAQKFEIVAYPPPEKRSQINIRHLHHQMSGNYFLQYVFEEADPRIQQNVYRGNFRLDVRYRTKMSITPKMVEICKGSSGTLTAHSSGGFALFKGSIKWKYGYSRTAVHGEISVDDPLFELSSDFKKLTVKELKKHTWIRVEGTSHTGISSALAEFKLKRKLHLLNRLRFLRAIQLVNDFKCH